MAQVERCASRQRRAAVRFLAALLVLLATGCGSSSAPDQLAEPSSQPNPVTTSATPTPAATAGGTGVVRTASPYPPASPRPSAPPSTLRPTASTVVVHDADSGSTLHLHVGQRLRVRLEQGTWDPPESGSAAVVRRSSSGGYPTDQPVDALFEAVTPGTADISASGDAACFHTEPRCLLPTRQWQVHVVVG